MKNLKALLLRSLYVLVALLVSVILPFFVWGLLGDLETKTPGWFAALQVFPGHGLPLENYRKQFYLAWTIDATGCLLLIGALYKLFRSIHSWHNSKS